MKLVACLISKGDEELEQTKRAIASVQPYVDGVYLTCNGKKVDKTKKYCDVIGVHYSYLKWDDDFAKQRNFNFSKAPKDTDYIFWMDSDDILVGGKNLRKIAEIGLAANLDCVLLTYWYSCLFDGEPSFETVVKQEIVHMRERLLNPKKMYWKGRLHETPMPYQGVSFKPSEYPYDKVERPVLVLHTSSNRLEDPKVTEARNERNQRILEITLKEERAKGKPDPRTLVYLMKLYADRDEPEYAKKCLAMGNEYLAMSGWNQERATCLILMGRCASHLGDDKYANTLYLKAVEEFPFIVAPYLRVAQSYLDIRDYGKAMHWFTMALKHESERKSEGIDSLLEDQIVAAEVGMRLHWEGDKKNFRKAYQFAKVLYELEPHQFNEDNMELLRSLSNLDIACEHTDKLLRYLYEEGEEKAVLEALHALPQAIASQPFAIRYLKKVAKPRIWGEEEICYLASFGQSHFEHWDGNSLQKGIGGSETAVIQLAEEWAKLGYVVTVYGDPAETKIINGVKYLPWYYFNVKDKFNILIQWRGSNLAGMVSAKKFYVDLHDITNYADFKGKEAAIDAIFVKSEAHKRMLKGFPDNKLVVISNGIV